MPIRLRITLLFTLAVFIILGVVSVAVYYFSASSRITTIKTRLMNRAITTSRLLSQSAAIDPSLVHRIDSLTTLSLKHKSVQAYDKNNWKFYYYSDTKTDHIEVDSEMLLKYRQNAISFFKQGRKEAVAYHNPNDADDIVVICAAEDEEGNNILRQLLQILIISFICGIFFSFIGGFIFSKRLLQPVRKITMEVSEISAYNLDRRIQTNQTKDEWFQLSSTLNGLLDRLKDSFELQRRFISNASHELSTPLTLISTQLEISLQRQRKEEEYRNSIKSVLKDVQHMNHLVQTLLSFATTAGNPGGLTIDQVRIDEVLMRIPSAVQKENKQFSVSLQFNDLPEEESKLLVFGNEELLLTSFRNIVANACKYSDDHHADVTLSINESKFMVTILDRGIGIPEKELDKIFQPFYRIDEDRSVKGFGLGLSLANRIIKLHRGTIKVTSIPSAGTTFTVELPGGQII